MLVIIGQRFIISGHYNVIFRQFLGRARSQAVWDQKMLSQHVGIDQGAAIAMRPGSSSGTPCEASAPCGRAWSPPRRLRAHHVPENH